MAPHDTTTTAGTIATTLSLAVGWLDEHHAAASVLIAALTGTVAIASGLYSMWCRYHDRKKSNNPD